MPDPAMMMNMNMNMNNNIDDCMASNNSGLSDEEEPDIPMANQMDSN